MSSRALCIYCSQRYTETWACDRCGLEAEASPATNERAGWLPGIGTFEDEDWKVERDEQEHFQLPDIGKFVGVDLPERKSTRTGHHNNHGTVRYYVRMSPPITYSPLTIPRIPRVKSSTPKKRRSAARDARLLRILEQNQDRLREAGVEELAELMDLLKSA